MAVKFTNNAKTTLASGINSSVTTATVTDGSVFPTLAAGEHFYCTFDDGTNNEIVKVTARSGNTLTIIRGVDNTTARSFTSGDAAELRATSALLTDIQENIAAKSANQTVYNTTTASSATDYDIGIDPSVEANAMVFLNGVMQHHDTFSFSGSTLTFDTAPPDGMALEVIVDNLINLQSSNLTVDTFTAADVGGNPQTDFTLSDAPAAEDNLLVFIDGVFQDQDAYTISNQTLTITDGVTADFGVTVYVINPVNIGTPSDGTVTSSKLSGNITMPADLTVTGDVAFDSPTFVVDNANSRVGIGTASPSTLLDIVGDVKMSANLTVDTDTLHVDSTNNRVGIGTSSPATNLHIGSGSTGSALGVLLSRGATTNFFVANDGTKSAYIGVDNSQGFIKMGSLTNHPVSISQGNSNAIYIDTSKNVGIGQTPVAFRSNSNEVGIQYGKRGVLFADTGLTTDIANNTFINSSNLRVAMETDFASYYQQYQGVHKWFNASSVSAGSQQTFSERMRIDTSGNVGIGTTSPSEMLHINNTTGTGCFIRFQNTGGSGVYIGGRSEVMEMYTNGSEKMRIDSSGNVGIGTNGPTGKLHVSGGRMGVIASGSYSSWGHFRIANTSDAEISMAFINGATESDFLNDGDPACAYKVVLGINPYGAGNRNFGIGNDTMANYHTIWTEDGHQLPRVNNTFDLGSATRGWRNIYTNDLNLSNMPPEGEDVEGNAYTREGNEVDGTNGSWTIQEGADDLFLINRRNGKKYKFNLTEVTD